MNSNDKLIDVLMIYNNYLHTLQYRKEFGDKYGDTEELIKIYEKKLKKYNVKVIEK